MLIDSYDGFDVVFDKDRFVFSIVAHGNINRIIELVLPIFNADIGSIRRNVAGSERG